MPKSRKNLPAQVDALTRRICGEKAAQWAQAYPLSLFSCDNNERQFTKEDLCSSYIAGIRNFIKSIWHEAQKEMPKDGEWCLLQTTSGFRLAVRRPMQSGVYKWWLMDYSMYDGRGLEKWAYVDDLILSV